MVSAPLIVVFSLFACHVCCVVALLHDTVCRMKCVPLARCRPGDVGMHVLLSFACKLSSVAEGPALPLATPWSLGPPGHCVVYLSISLSRYLAIYPHICMCMPADPRAVFGQGGCGRAHFALICMCLRHVCMYMPAGLLMCRVGKEVVFGRAFDGDSNCVVYRTTLRGEPCALKVSCSTSRCEAVVHASAQLLCVGRFGSGPT